MARPEIAPAQSIEAVDGLTTVTPVRARADTATANTM
jgi:hypothetical protein